MTKEAIISQVMSWPADDRIALADALWSSVETDPDALPLTNAQKAELDRRLAADLADPSRGSPWEQVKQRLERRHDQ